MKKQTEVPFRAYIIRGASDLLLLVAAMFIGFVGSQASTRHLPRTLSFAERVSYQQAIEEVYWRHRIWPKENPNPKPSLDAVMSQQEIEDKVKESLRNSQLLADQWQKPITPAQLQVEIDRIAIHTRQPGVLRELFAALRNDPFIVAECLARPLLSERLVREVQVRSNPLSEAPSVQSLSKAKTPSTDRADFDYYLPGVASSPIEDPASACDDNWTATSTTGAPAARAQHVAVWTGAEMIVWGGSSFSLSSNTGGRYNPSTDSWAATSSIRAPNGRDVATAVWTGSEMIVWGGSNCCYVFENTGGRYNPMSDKWLATTTVGAPDERAEHTAVWTGSEMIVWGGINGCCFAYLNSGGRYNPSTNSWVPTTTIGAPDPRHVHTAVWTGSEMIVWGGEFGNYFNTGGRYNPGTDSWVSTTTIGAPEPRAAHASVWTGSEMIVWGGSDLGDELNSGGRYNPITDSWLATTNARAPMRRSYPSAVWTGAEMIVWGGSNFPNGLVRTGGRYNPITDSWFPTSLTDAPEKRANHTAVWTGTEMIVWGGFGPRPSGTLNSGGRYCAAVPTPTPTPTPGPIQLTGQGKKVGGINTSRLRWRGATSAALDVYRDGVVIATAPNDGLYDDSTGTTGQASFTYQVCEAGTSTCSSEVRVNFPP
jgi:hypothetical protein